MAALEFAFFQDGLAYGLGAQGPGLAVLLSLLCCFAWLAVEAPVVEPAAWPALARFGAGLLLVGVGQYLLYPVADGKDAWAALGFAEMAGGAALLWPFPSERIRLAAWAAIAALGLLGLCTAASRFRTQWDLFAGPPQGQVGSILFWLFLALVLGALAWGAAGRESAPAQDGPPLPRALEAALLAGVLCVAAALRFYKAGQIPPGWWYDEVVLTRSCQDILMFTSGTVPLYLGGAVQNPGAFFWTGAAIFKFFGADIAVLRVASGAFGLLAMLPFWALARQWMGQRWALASTLVFGAMHWALIPERTAFMSSFALFWMLASFWALWTAQRRGGPWRWLLAGMLLGANFHTYIPGRLAPFLVLGFLALQAAVDPAWRRSRTEWAAFFGGFLAVAGPMLLWLSRHWQEYLQRTQEVSIFSAVSKSGQPLGPALWGSFAKHALMFNFRGDFNARHNISSYPHADFILACALALAFPWTLGRAWRDPRARFLWLWLSVMLAAGIFSLPIEAPQGNRCILAAPLLPLAACWSMRELLAPLRGALKGPLPRAALALGACLLAGLVFLNAWNVFEVWAPSAACFRDFSPRASAVARRMLAAQAGTVVYVSPLPKEYPGFGFEWIQFADFISRQRRLALDVLRPSQALGKGIDGKPVCGALLIWGSSDADITRAFHAEFPDLAMEQAAQPYPGPGEADFLYLAAQVPAARVPPKPKRGPLPLLYRDP
jgi:4-amino-4-deoxy-L-arabinose transferase-like glycosyltransferase